MVDVNTYIVIWIDSNSENLAGSLGKSSRFDDDQNDSSEDAGVIGGGRMYEASQVGVNNSTFVNATSNE